MTRSLHQFTFCSCFLILCGVLALSIGCGAEDVVTTNPPVPVADDPEADAPEAEETGSSEEATDTAEPRETTISGFRFNVPAGWREVELKPEQQGFVNARYEIPAAGEDVDLTFTTSGGGVQANVDRWIGQFTLPDGVSPEIESLTVNGIDVTWVELQGTFDPNAGRPFGDGTPPRDDWMMIGVVYDGQPRGFFLKLTGPKESIEGLNAEFRSFVESARVQ